MIEAGGLSAPMISYGRAHPRQKGCTVGLSSAAVPIDRIADIHR